MDCKPRLRSVLVSTRDELALWVVYKLKLIERRFPRFVHYGRTRAGEMVKQMRESRTANRRRFEGFPYVSGTTGDFTADRLQTVRVDHVPHDIVSHR